jgi:hypothetical protein
VAGGVPFDHVVLDALVLAVVVVVELRDQVL